MEQEIKKKTEEIYNSISLLHDKMANLWINNVVFTWQWYLGVSLVVFPIVLWMLFRKKESTGRLLLAGFFMVIISMTLDLIGVALGFWHYYYEVFPLIPSHVPWNIVLLPIMTMFFIQIMPHQSSYLKGTIFAALNSFISEPLAQLVGIYEPKEWKSIYSLGIYFVIYTIAHKLIMKVGFKEIEK